MVTEQLGAPPVVNKIMAVRPMHKQYSRGDYSLLLVRRDDFVDLPGLGQEDGNVYGFFDRIGCNFIYTAGVWTLQRDDGRKVKVGPVVASGNPNVNFLGEGPGGSGELRYVPVKELLKDRKCQHAWYLDEAVAKLQADSNKLNELLQIYADGIPSRHLPGPRHPRLYRHVV